MPRDHGRVLCAIWRDKDFRQRSPEAQRMYMLLLSQSNVNNAGVLPLQVSKWARGCEGTSVGDVEAALDELVAHRFVFYDEDTEEVLIRSYMRNDGVLKHRYIWMNALRCAEHTESPVLREVLAEELMRTRRKDAELVAAKLTGNAPEPDPDAVEMPSETDPDDQSHSNGIRITRGRGKGKGRVSPSVGGTGGEEPAPPKCSKHKENSDAPCRACGRRREWEERQEKAGAEAAADLKRLARERSLNCPVCEGTNWVPDTEPAVKCDHEGVV